jgi:hypothetical protein
MKKRNGFISNSSSSSFVVFGSSDVYSIPQMPKNLKDKTTLSVPFIFGGEIEFGRQRDNYRDFGSRLNFAYLQAKSLQDAYLDDCKQFYTGFKTPEITELLNNHCDDVQLLEKVLIKHINGLKKIDWRLLDYHEFQKRESKNNFESGAWAQGYIDHGSLWHDKLDVYLDIFKDEDTLFEWLFNNSNYIANRSDEYDDSDDLEVNHRYDYDNYRLFWNSYDNPEMFDENHNFIGENNEN